MFGILSSMLQLNLLKNVASVQFISTLLQQIYSEQKCVYLIDNDKTASLLLSQSLLHINLQILNINWFILAQTTLKSCSGYIVTTANLSATGKALEEEFKNNGKIFAYERIAIFSNSLKNCQIFDQIIDLYGLHIIVIKTNGKKANAKHILESSKWIPKEKFQSSVFHCTPFFYIEENGNIIGGSEFQFIETALQHIEHTYNVLNKSSFLEGTDKWETVKGNVVEKKSDLAGCSQWHASLNFSLVDATYPLRQDCLTALVPKPQLLPSYTFILQPFSLFLWLALLSILFIVVFAFSQISRVYKIIEKVGLYNEGQILIIFDLLRLLTLGGISKIPSPNQYTFRILFLVWLAACVYYPTYYSAGITSSLSKPKVTRVVKTIDNMVSYGIKWDEILFIKDSFEKSNIENLNKLAKLSTQNLNENVARLTKQIGNFYLTDTESLDPQQRQRLTVLKECFGSYYVVFVMKKHSPYTSILNKYQARFFEQGLFEFWLKNITYFNNSNNYFRTLYSDIWDNINTIYIDLNRLMGVFYMLFLGDFVAFLVFMSELARKKI